MRGGQREVRGTACISGKVVEHCSGQVTTTQYKSPYKRKILRCRPADDISEKRIHQQYNNEIQNNNPKYLNGSFENCFPEEIPKPGRLKNIIHF